MREKMSDLVMVNMQKAIRMKHYSLSTERTYLDWARRFFDYAGNIKGGLLRETPGAEDIREFLTHLTVDKNVSASTQNQAFNAILFLYRNVLNIYTHVLREQGIKRAKSPLDF